MATKIGLAIKRLARRISFSEEDLFGSQPRIFTVEGEKKLKHETNLATVLPGAVKIAPTTGCHDFELPAAVTGCGGGKRVAGRRRGDKSEWERRGVEAHGTRAKRSGMVLVRPDI